ncbi:145_t:CDS:1, partial [Diversispora eburnea]
EMSTLRRHLSFVSYRIWDIVVVAEKSLLTKINGTLSLLEILLKADWNDFII